MTETKKIWMIGRVIKDRTGKEHRQYLGEVAFSSEAEANAYLAKRPELTDCFVFGPMTGTPTTKH